MNAALKRLPMYPRNARQWKFVEGMLDMLPYDDWDETGLTEWLRLLEGGLRQFYELPARSVSLPEPPETK